MQNAKCDNETAATLHFTLLQMTYRICRRLEIGISSCRNIPICDLLSHLTHPT